MSCELPASAKDEVSYELPASAKDEVSYELPASAKDEVNCELACLGERCGEFFISFSGFVF
jgi:hypothetical protein